MKHVFIAVILAFSLTFAARGAEAPLPENVAAHVTVGLPATLIEEAFTYVDTATKDTQNHISTELLAVLLAAYLPVPLDVWDATSPLHLVFLDSEEMHTMVVVFGHGSFPELLEGLADTGWDVPEKPLDNEDENLFREVRMVGMSSGMPMFLADLGDGRAVLAEDIEAARYVLAADGAELERGATSDIAARIRLAGMADAEETARDMAEGIVEVAFAGTAGEWAEDLAEKYGELLGGELENAEEARVALDFDGELFSAAVSVLFADGSWMRKWAETMEAAPARPESRFLAALPEGAFSLAAVASPGELLPGAEAITATVLSDIAAMSDITPEQKTALDGFAGKIFAAAPGVTAAANYLNAGKPYQLAVTEFADADAALKAVESIRSVIGQSFADAGEPGMRFHAARLEGEDALVFAAGGIGDGEFAEILRRVGEAAGADAEPDAAPAGFGAGSFDAAVPAQFFSGLTNAAEGFLAFSLRMMELEGGSLPPALFSGLERPDPAAPVVSGVGAEDGRVAVRAAIPAAAVKAGILANARLARANSGELDETE